MILTDRHTLEWSGSLAVTCTGDIGVSVGGSVHQTHEAEHWKKSHGDRRGKKGGIHRALSNKNIDAGFSSSFTDGSFFQGFRRGFPLAAFPPPPSRCLASGLQYSRCYSQTVCTTFQPSARTSFKSKLAGNPRGGGATALGAGLRGRQHHVTARLGLWLSAWANSALLLIS